MDLFMLDGEQIIVDILANMVQIKKKKILQLDELELMNYLRKDMAVECFAEYPMSKFVSMRPLVLLHETAQYLVRSWIIQRFDLRHLYKSFVDLIFKIFLLIP